MSSLADNPNLAGGRLTIDLGAIADNWRLLDGLSGESECGAVVKANAYGLGIEQVVTILWKAGCRTFFVALPEEGIRVRKTLPDAVIYVLAGYFANTIDTYTDFALRPIINDEFNSWVEAAGDKALPYGIQLETGMNRLGMPVVAYQNLRNTDTFQDYQPSLVISHLACADTPDNPLNEVQKANFNNAIGKSNVADASLANSAGIFLGQSYHYDMVRPGIALYGGAAAIAHLQSNPMRPVVTIEARILQVKSAQPGATVGYGGAETIRAPEQPERKDRVIATLSVGYSDGYLRSASSSDQRQGAFAAWRGIRVPLLGRVSMDLVTVDMTDHPDVEELLGGNWQNQWIELIGSTISLDEAASAAGTIGYELLTSLGMRYHRTYINHI